MSGIKLKRSREFGCGLSQVRSQQLQQTPMYSIELIKSFVTMVHVNASDKIVCEMAAMLSKRRWVNEPINCNKKKIFHNESVPH